MTRKSITQTDLQSRYETTYASIRRTYVRARIEEILKQPGFRPSGNWRQAAKDQAHREFNDFVREEKARAIAEAKPSDADEHRQERRSTR